MENEHAHRILTTQGARELILRYIAEHKPTGFAPSQERTIFEEIPGIAEAP